MLRERLTNLCTKMADAIRHAPTPADASSADSPASSPANLILPRVDRILQLIDKAC